MAGGTAVGMLLNVAKPPDPGETVVAKRMAYIDGGKAAGQAIGIARLGADTFLVSALGDDALGDRLRALLSRENVDSTGVVTIPGEGSMLGIVVIDEQGENQIVVALNAMDKLTPELVRAQEPVIAKTDYCLVSLEMPADAALETLVVARESGVTTVLNPAPAPSSDVARELAPLADYISPNETEAAAMIGEEGEDEDLARRLIGLGAGAVAMTLGARGALYVDSETVDRVPAVEVDQGDIVDTAGAGDAFNAAFVVALAKGKSPTEACSWGCEAGSRIVQGPGFVEALHTWEGLQIS